MMNRKIITEAWMVKIWLYRSPSNGGASGNASCKRTSSAASPPIRKKRNVLTMYMIPIFL
jgi:hypothetical protein